MDFWPSPLRPLQLEPIFKSFNVPRKLPAFVWNVSATDQIYLVLLSVLVAAIGTVPIDMQRRIVNAALKDHDFGAIETLAGAYVMLVLTQGLVKLLTNSYRAWVSTNAVRLLRTSISAIAYREDPDIAERQGVKISMIITEADAVGNFVGDSIAEPVLAGSILIFTFGYLFYLQPLMALISALIFIVQMIFVPMIQREINRRVEKRIAILRRAGTDVIEEDGSPTTQYMHRFTKVFRLDVRIFNLKYTLNFLMNLIQHLGTIGVIAFGAWFVMHGSIQVGTVVAFLSGLASMIDPWGDFVTWYQNYMVSQTKYDLIQKAAVALGDEPPAEPVGAEAMRELALP
ncbi:ABC transporter transmembrane domain-containing protein [Methylovirgula sp. 4M-Z18]|uniref:ABC transporter transmembrane domain-containing protein n=1 Tax=Methylovirgula sp. 4M-Z18 TaxID=2293567 RepID=UPI00131490E9|nr:ABC transporter ATP-binding protein [Methylovirgula sp. 4M-Z18]